MFHDDSAAIVQFRYSVPGAKQRPVRSSSLFSLEWLAKLLRHEEDDSNADRLNDEMTAQLKLKSISVREALNVWL